MNSVNQLVEKRMSTEEVFEGKLLHVFFDEARLPNGQIGTREWIKHPGACAVVPVFENGDVMLVRQFRYPAQQIFWEVPAGKIDSGEPHDKTAFRELEEETGLTAESFRYVGHFYPGIGYSDEVIHIYLAWGLKILEQNMDDDEFLLKERVPFKQAVEMVHNGEINDGKTVVCLLRAWDFWNNKLG